ncbi:hypothetical protein B0H17DRAFT_1212740 [Mycena rosella]|uniref:Uncharacterized protein n=1 Tax=Mycena rosella TaxID=1033263 RepID=A0AAD7CRU7_MYCRO|nr:hypothetical protein B0H17DRAFT_1212740 [Mycena rosella]
MDSGEILRRMDTAGPVPRSLFKVAAPEVTTETLTGAINSALGTNIFNFNPVDDSGSAETQPVHRVIRIEPLVVIDSSGRARLQRTDYSAEFMSSARIAQRTLDLLENRLEELQTQLAATLDIPSTRTLAGKVVAALMQRALERGLKLPEVFGPVCTVAKTLLTQRASSAKSPWTSLIITFAAVDAILVPKTMLGLIQVSRSD